MVPINRKEYINMLAELGKLKTEAAAAITQKDSLAFHDAGALEIDYMRKVGSLENEILVLEHDLRKLQRKIEVIRAYSFDVEDEDLRLIDMQVDMEFSQAGSEIKSRQRKEEILMYAEDHTHHSPEEERIVTRVYCRLVKILHPDLNPDADRFDMLLWQRAQAAFIRNDGEEILQLEDECEMVCEIVPCAEQAELIEERMEKYKEIIMKMNETCKKVLQSYPFTYKEKLADDDWVLHTKLINHGMLDYLKKTYEDQMQVMNGLLEKKRS